MSSMFVFHLLFVGFLCHSAVVESLECYTCQEYGGDIPSDIQGMVECTDSNKQTCPDGGYCMKADASMSIEVGDKTLDIEMTMKGCATASEVKEKGKCQDLEDAAADYDIDLEDLADLFGGQADVSGTICNCDGNLCNSSVKPGVAGPIIVGLLALTLWAIKP